MKFQASRLVRELGKITTKLPKANHGDEIATMAAGEFEFHFINGPLITGPADAMVGKLFKPPYFAWWDTQDAAAGTSTTHAQAFRHKGEVVYAGLDNALRRIVKYMAQHGPFDALMGFSQGGMFANILAFLHDYISNAMEIDQNQDPAAVVSEIAQNIGVAKDILRQFSETPRWKVSDFISMQTCTHDTCRLL